MAENFVVTACQTNVSTKAGTVLEGESLSARRRNNVWTNSTALHRRNRIADLLAARRRRASRRLRLSPRETSSATRSRIYALPLDGCRKPARTRGGDLGLQGHTTGSDATGRRRPLRHLVRGSLGHRTANRTAARLRRRPRVRASRRGRGLIQGWLDVSRGTAKASRSSNGRTLPTTKLGRDFACLEARAAAGSTQKEKKKRR